MPPLPRLVKFVCTPNGVQSFVEKPGVGLVPHKLYAESEAAQAAAKAQAAGWKVVQEQATQINNAIRTPQGLNTGATINLNLTSSNNLPHKAIPNQITSPEIGNPEIRTSWGTVARRPAFYTQADLINPKYGALPPGSKQYIDLENSLADLDEWQQYGLRQGTLGDFMQRANYTPANNRTNALGERQILTSDQNYIFNNYRQELGEVPPSIQPARKAFVTYKDPNYPEVFRQYINSGRYPQLESRASNFFKGTTPLPNAPTLQYTIDAIEPKGMRTLLPESDFYSMAPQSAYSQEPPRNIRRFPTYPEAPIQQLGSQAYPDQIASYQR